MASKTEMTSPNAEEMMSPEGVKPTIQMTERPVRRNPTHVRSVSDTVFTIVKSLAAEVVDDDITGADDDVDMVDEESLLISYITNGAKTVKPQPQPQALIKPNGEADGKGVQGESSAAAQAKPRGGFPSVDHEKRIKRLVANRISAQKSRMRKNEQLEKLEKDCRTLQQTVEELRPQVAYQTALHTHLERENIQLKRELEAREREMAEEEAANQELKEERDMLAFTHFLQSEGL